MLVGPVQLSVLRGQLETSLERLGVAQARQPVQGVVLQGMGGGELLAALRRHWRQATAAAGTPQPGAPMLPVRAAARAPA
jgi:hypothetical protein